MLYSWSSKVAASLCWRFLTVFGIEGSHLKNFTDKRECVLIAYPLPLHGAGARSTGRMNLLCSVIRRAK